MDYLNLSLSQLFPLISLFCILLLGFITLFKGHGGISKMFFLITLVFAFWEVGTFMMFTSQTDEQIIFWDKFIYAGVVFLPVLEYNFSVAFTYYNKARKRILILGYLLSFIFLGLNFTNYFVDGVFRYKWGAHTIAQIGHHFFVVFFFGYIFLLLYTFFKQYKVSRNKIEKSKILYFIIGFSILNILGGMGYLPAYKISVYPICLISPLIFSFLIAYAILKYHLMDVWVVLRLGTIFTLSLGSIIFFFTSVNYLLASFFRVEKPFDIVIPSLFITIGFMPLKRFVEFITDEMFFRYHYKFNDVIQNIEREIHSAGLDLDKSLSVVNQVVSSSLKVDRSVIMILIPRDHFISRQIIGDQISNLEFKHNNPIISYLNSFPGQILDREEIERNIDINGLSDCSRQEIVDEMKRIGISLVVPIEFKDKLIGAYLLGGKMSEDSFSDEDLRLLQHVAWEMSFVIDNARSYEELKHLDEAKSNFIQVVSHQMRTPVTITRCNLELALDKDLSSEEREGVLKAAYDGVSSLGHQLDQLLTVLEIEEKEMVVRKEPVDLNSIINGFIEDNRISIKNKKLKLETHLLDSVSSTINCDGKRIRRVLDILLLNSINYTPSGGKVVVSVSQDGFNGKSSLIVSVADNGVGINEVDKANLFKKFFRSPEAISMFPNGFGLGLFIARKIVRAHGGDIWFEGRDHEGMTFSFSIPFKNSNHDKKYE